MVEPSRTMERSLELPAVIAVSISAMLGSGIFVLPGLAAAATGPSLWLAYLLAAVFIVPAAVAKSELATAMPASGGTYVYLDRAFGPLAGTVAGLGLWVSLLLKSSFALVGMGAYLAAVADAPLKPVALLLVAVIVLINIRGVKGVGQAQLIMVSVSIVALAGMVAVGVPSFETELLEPAFPHGPIGLLAATGLVFVSYDGVTKVAAIAEEVRSPGRNLPLGILLSLAIVAAVYTAVTFVLAGNIPEANLQGDLRPIYTLALKEGGEVVGMLAAIIGVLTMASMANAGVLAASRFPFAMSRDDLLPPALGHLHHRFLTPVAAIILSGLVVAGTIVFLDVERIAKLASSFVILIFMAESFTVIVLRETRVQWYRPRYRGPLYPWLHAFGILSGAVLLVLMGSLVAAGLAFVALPGLVLFVFYGRRRTARIGVVAQRGPRQKLLRGDDSSVVTVQSRPMEEQARVLVPLFGGERSPEMLVEAGSALAGGERTQVVHLTEVPEQTTLEAAVEEEEVAIDSLARRIGAMSEQTEVPIAFDAVVSRDIIKTVHQLSESLKSDWLIMEWGGRTTGLFTMSNPLGWLVQHVHCNLATFHDAGVRYIRKILVYVEPGPHDSLVVDTAEHLAMLHGADLTAARFVSTQAPLTVAQSAADYLDQVHQLFTGDSHTLLLKGADEALTVAKATAAYDLLVMGAPPLRLVDRMFGSARDQMTEEAACSVLRVQTPRARTHEAIAKRDTIDFGESILLRLVEPDCVQARLDGLRKEALFNHFAQAFSAVIEDVDAAEIVAGLWERERMQNTAVGDGLALPHATIPTAGRTRLGIFTLKSPTRYQAPDGLGVDVFFVTLGPASDRQTHLQLLASIAKMVLDTSLLERLRAAKTASDVIDAIRRCGTEL